MPSFFERQIVGPVRVLLLQEITLQKIALSLACGVVFGIFPIVGSTTLLCTIVALLFGLNLVAMQAANYLVYPAQLALIVPFIRAGEVILHSSQTRLTLAQIVLISRGGLGQAIHLLWRLAIQGIVAWTLFAPVAAFLLYWIFLAVTVRVARALPGINVVEV